MTDLFGAKFISSVSRLNQNMTLILKTVDSVQTMIHLVKGRQATKQIDQCIVGDESKVKMLSISTIVCGFLLLLINVPAKKWIKVK